MLIFSIVIASLSIFNILIGIYDADWFSIIFGAVCLCINVWCIVMYAKQCVKLENEMRQTNKVD